ncbi:MAG: iron ABC transporter permease [Acetobacterales bacterium]
MAVISESPVAGFRRRGFRIDPWLLAAAPVAIAVAVPPLAVLWLAVTATDPAFALETPAAIWAHLLSTVLPGYAWTTVRLAAGVGVGTLVIGVATAWLVTVCRFPGRRVFEWALLLPMAMPGYIIAFLYIELLEFAGPVQRALRAVFGWHLVSDYWFPEIRSLGGAICMLTLVLYPYVFLLARAAFIEQSVCALEVSRTLGRGPWRTFFSVAVPMARPSIVIGLALVMMETISDFGTVSLFAVNSFTVGIFSVWLTMNSAAAASQLSLVLLAIVLGLLWVERRARAGRRFHNLTTRMRPQLRMELRGTRAWLAALACAVPVVLGFVLPAGILVYYAALTWLRHEGAEFLTYAGNSLMLAGIAASVTAVLGLLVAYGCRLRDDPLLRGLARVASVGYAVPGAVLAIGILVPFGALDNAIDGFMRDRFGVSTGLLLSGTIFALVYAYVARFFALGYGAIEAGFGKVPASMDQAARVLGHGPAATLMRVQLPLVRGSVLTGALLVFVDSMKELPATLLLRPFNFDTLATYVYQYAKDELIEQTGLAALAIVVAGVVPVILLSRTITRFRAGIDSHGG